MLAAVSTSLIALWTSARDRLNAQDIAAKDRRVSVLVRELECAVRLADVTAFGGSTDSDQVKRVGAWRLALILVLSERVPAQWESFTEVASAQEIRDVVTDDDPTTLVARRRNESVAAILDILDDLRDAARLALKHRARGAHTHFGSNRQGPNAQTVLAISWGRSQNRETADSPHKPTFTKPRPTYRRSLSGCSRARSSRFFGMENRPQISCLMSARP